MLFHKKIKKKTKYKHKKNVYLLILVCILIVFNMSPFLLYSSNVVIPVIPTETTKKKPRGVKVENAEFHDEYWDKFRVITAEGEGGSGTGGGQAGTGQSGATGSGVSNGVNNASGIAGTGGSANAGGSGSGNNSGGPGGGNSSVNYNVQSNREIRESREAAQAARESSIAAELATAKNRESVRASIAERESIQESIKKRLIQESIKQKVFGDSYVETSYRLPTTTAREMPTSEVRPIVPPERQTAPTSAQVDESIKRVPETTQKQVNNAMGVYVAPETEYTSQEETTTMERKEINLVPSAASTYANNENDIMPTSDYYEETSIVPEESYEQNNTQESATENSEDNNVDNQETKQSENETKTDNNEDVKESKEDKKENNKQEHPDDNQGGTNGDGDVANQNDNMSDNNMNSNDNDSSSGIDEVRKIEGEHKGVKIFELDRNGNPGIFDKGTTRTYLINIMLVIFTGLLFLGFIHFYLNQVFHVKYKSYF